jgi:hypothetical protein
MVNRRLAILPLSVVATNKAFLLMLWSGEIVPCGRSLMERPRKLHAHPLHLQEKCYKGITMQVLCMATEGFADISCKICGQKYKLYFERQSREEREMATSLVEQTLSTHHALGDDASVHPEKAFNVPEWAGLARWSGAALLGGAPLI